MSISEPPERYPTAAAIDSLARRFGLPNHPGMQDWPWEVADAERLDEFLAAYENGGLDDDERFTLMEILLQSFEDLGRSTGFDARWDRILEILDRNIDLHACSVWYWADLEKDNEEDQWVVTPFLRRLVEKHRGRFETSPMPAGPVPEITLRVAVDSDALPIGALATQVFLDTYATDGIRPSVAREVHEYFSPAAVSALLSAPATRFLLAERAGHLIGFAQITLDAAHELVSARPAAELKRLYVQERSAGSGVGKALLGEAEALVAREGAATLWLIVWAENTKAQAFYVRRGYEELGTDSYVYENEQYETRIFAKALDPRF